MNEMQDAMDGGTAGRMRVFDAMQMAVAHAKRMCFPFHFEHWLALGVIIFLDVLTGAGPGSQLTLHTSYNNSDIRESLQPFQTNMDEMWDVVRDTWVSIAAIIVVGGILLLALRILLLYLGCRGQLMFVRAVALERYAIGEQWIATGRHAMSLFWFYLELMLFAYAFNVVLFIIGIIMVQDQIFSSAPDVFRILATLSPLIIAGVIFGMAYSIAKKLTRHFVSPLMLHFDLSCWEAWGRFRDIARGNWLSIIGLIVLQWVYALALGFATTLVGCCTCLVGFLPVIHQTIFAPVYVFDRAVSLYMLQQLGPAYSPLHRHVPPSLPPEG